MTALIPTELVARLEAASVGSRELDAEIWSAVVGCDRAPFRYWAPVDEHRGHGEPRPGALYYAPHCAQVFVTPEVTTSLDAALALAERVLPGTQGNVSFGDGGGHQIAIIWRPTGDMPDVLAETAANTPALALCIAILKARTASSVGIREADEPQTPPLPDYTGVEK